ncbi:MAG: hypothetical protein ACR652_25135 [Methylocystis sp.]|uniref:hypothetical protein n=1 Tax=Methylocystis sp. TaxID=1911079 RepID=UPI003DA2BF64
MREARPTEPSSNEVMEEMLGRARKPLDVIFPSLAMLEAASKGGTLEGKANDSATNSSKPSEEPMREARLTEPSSNEVMEEMLGRARKPLFTRNSLILLANKGLAWVLMSFIGMFLTAGLDRFLGDAIPSLRENEQAHPAFVPVLGLLGIPTLIAYLTWRGRKIALVWRRPLLFFGWMAIVVMIVAAGSKLRPSTSYPNDVYLFTILGLVASIFLTTAMFLKKTASPESAEVGEASAKDSESGPIKGPVGTANGAVDDSKIEQSDSGALNPTVGQREAP